MMFSLSIILVYLGFYFFIVFLSLSIACGLYYLAELIEEYSRTTKRVISIAIRAELVLHLLLFIDRLPFTCLAIGFGSHVAYSRLLKKFPYMNFTSADGLIAFSAFLLNNFAWIFHYRKTYFTIEYIVAFMLVTTWIVPLGFFLSLAGEQAVLPGAGGYPYTMQSAGSNDSAIESFSHQGKQRRTLALRIFDVLRRKRDEVLPDVLSRMPASSGLMPKENMM